MTWADVAKILLGAALSVVGGFLAQMKSESLRLKEHDHQLLVNINKHLSILYERLAIGVSGGSSSQNFDILRDLYFEAMQLRTRRTKTLAVQLLHLVQQYQILVKPDTVMLAINATQALLNPKLLTAFQGDDLTKMIQEMKNTSAS